MPPAIQASGFKIRRSMSTIDAVKLGGLLEGYFGTAASDGFPVAMTVLVGASRLTDCELCKYAKQHGMI